MGITAGERVGEIDDHPFESGVSGMNKFLAMGVATGALIMVGCSNSASASVSLDTHHNNQSGGQHEYDQDGDVSLIGSDLNISGRIGGDLSLIGSDLSIQADIGSDLSLVGSDIDFNGNVGGETSVAGSDVNWSGEASGDVDIAGSDVNWSGSSDGDVSIAGSDINIDGRVSEDLDIAGSDVLLSTDSVVGGDVSIVGSDIEMFGEIVGNADLVGSSIEITGAVQGRLLATAFSRRGWSWSSDDTHQRIRLDASVGEGSAVCARRVVIGSNAGNTGSLAVFAEEAPVFEDGAPQLGVTFEEIGDRDCDDLLDPFDR